MINPYSTEHQVEVAKARQQLGQLVDFYQKLSACGVDCTEREIRRQQLDGILAAYESHFFPQGSQP